MTQRVILVRLKWWASAFVKMGICVLCCEALDILKGATEIWEINASFIMMSENPTNRDRSRHVDVKVHFLRELVRDGQIKLVNCAGTKNMSDALTKRLKLKVRGWSYCNGVVALDYRDDEVIVCMTTPLGSSR